MPECTAELERSLKLFVSPSLFLFQWLEFPLRYDVLNEKFRSFHVSQIIKYAKRSNAFSSLNFRSGSDAVMLISPVITWKFYIRNHNLILILKLSSVKQYSIISLIVSFIFWLTSSFACLLSLIHWNNDVVSFKLMTPLLTTTFAYWVDSHVVSC